MPKWLFLLVIVLVAEFGSVAAQSDLQLRLGRPDVSDFPLVRVNVLTADSRSTPLADLSGLRLRESGVPIADFELRTVPAGIDVIFVIDANESILTVDGSSGLTRYENVQASLTRYATRFMNPGGLDRITVVVPDPSYENGRLLLDNATDPAEVTEAIEGYIPEPAGGTPLAAMMSLAVTHAAQHQREGRFQAVLLFSDAGGLNQQLDYPELVAQAQATNLPVFAAILGGQATVEEIQNVARLAEPTRAFHVPMPAASGADPIYLIWQRQANQPQIEYRSLQTRSGRYPITVNLGQVTASTMLELSIEPPQVSIELADDVVRRAGTAVDTPLTELQPRRQPILVALSWPDSLPRQLATVTLLVNGQPIFLPELPAPDADGQIILPWDISNVDSGAYEVVVEVTDVLGLSATSEAAVLTVVIERPLPPTPTAIATAAPPLTVTVPDTEAYRDELLLALAALSLVAIMLFGLRWRGRRRSPADTPAEREQAATIAPEPEPVATGAMPELALLELLEEASGNQKQIRVEGDNVTIGGDESVAQILLSDKSVARLHARIRRRDGAYWLYDEGSASGTFLNHERLGLAPKLLRDQDLVRFGRVALRFHLRPPAAETALAEPAATNGNELREAQGEDTEVGGEHGVF